MDTTQLLINDYLDDELDAGGLELLADALRNNPNLVDDLAINSFIHSQLVDWMSQRRVQDKALLEPFVSASNRARAGFFDESQANGKFEGPAEVAPLRSSSRSYPPTGSQSRLRFFAGIAAAVLVLASIAAFAYSTLSRPVIVAQLTETKGSRWEGSQANLAVGTLLEKGQQLRLVNGHALVTFVSGAQIVLEGPTVLRLDGDMAAHMEAGRLTAKVPTQAIGFTITSSLARFIDLGTEFTVELGAGGDFEIHVFDGMVEVQLDDPSRQSVQKLRVAESQSRAVRFTPESAKPENIPYDPSQRMSLQRAP